MERYQNDSLNRLVNGYTDNGYFAGTDSDGNGSLNVAWSIDLFGNNKGETFSAGPTGELSNMPLTQPIQLTFNGNNNRADQFAYDSAGRVKQDYLNRYLYDAEGRVCAAQSLPGGAITLYLYDAEGNRIAKGGGSGSFACVTASATASSFSPQKWFILDGAEQQMTEMDYGSGAWQWAHSDVFAGSKLLATYCATGTAYCNTSTPTTFALSDWLGTKRVEATAAGGIDGNGQDTYASLPYGDQEFNGTGATEHFYTGKERDTESGNDYFGARYYSSAMGRFMSPDWSAKAQPVPYAKMDDPQTLNLYGYLRNNPLGGVDADGHCGGGPNDPPCSDVKVEAKVQEQPKITVNEKQEDGTSKTGVRGKLQDTITVGGKPLADTKVNESNATTLTVNGKDRQAPLDQGPAATNNAGQLGDRIGVQAPADPAQDKDFVSAISSAPITFTSTQTLTFTIPDGSTCSATSTRTLTNIGPDGQGSANYTLTTTQPVVKPVTPNP